MLTRVKTFDATGVAPNGKLYAGDLNAIQDAVAAASDLAQTIGAASYQVGESGLTIVRFGAGEARVTGALRTDGKVRAGGGLDVGMTTAQRDAIPPGSRPPGMLIFNTTTGRPEANMGSDASPSWQGQYTEVPVGAMIDWPWAAAGIPSWAALCYGQPVSRTTYAALNALAAAAGYAVYGAGDGSTTFNLPDMRGRIGVGKDNMGGTTPSWVDGSAIGRITVAICGFNGTVLGAIGGAGNIILTTGQIPAHTHPATSDLQGAHTPAGTVNGAGTGIYSSDGGGGTTYLANASTYIVDGAGGHSHVIDVHKTGGTYGAVVSAQFQGNMMVAPASGGVDASYSVSAGGHNHSISDPGHRHSFTDPGHGHTFTGTAVGNHQHGITVNNNSPADAAHFNCQPSIVVNKMMRVL